jgi:hypothetical protein
MPTPGVRVDPTGDFIGNTRSRYEPPTGGSLGVDRWCVSSADSESIAEATADRKRLEQGNEIGARL